MGVFVLEMSISCLTKIFSGAKITPVIEPSPPQGGAFYVCS